MIEENQNIENEIFEALPIPDDAVILNKKRFLDVSQLALMGIKEIIRQRGINLKVKKKRDVTELDCIFEINNFSIQVIFAGFSSDHIIVPLKRWFKITASSGMGNASKISLLLFLFSSIIYLKPL